jgi:hypothetical protein
MMIEKNRRGIQKDNWEEVSKSCEKRKKVCRSGNEKRIVEGWGLGGGG